MSISQTSNSAQAQALMLQLQTQVAESIAGDDTQVDLPGGARSGLRSAIEILDTVDDIHIAELTSVDVVRHRLVSEIVDAYAKFEEPGLTMNRAARRASNSRGRR